MNSQSYLSVTCQGMVEGKTYREKISGRYLTKVISVERVKEHCGGGQLKWQ